MRENFRCMNTKNLKYVKSLYEQSLYRVFQKELYNLHIHIYVSCKAIFETPCIIIQNSGQAGPNLYTNIGGPKEVNKHEIYQHSTTGCTACRFKLITVV
jgi:hypothetical protein